MLTKCDLASFEQYAAEVRAKKRGARWQDVAALDRANAEALERALHQSLRSVDPQDADTELRKRTLLRMRIVRKLYNKTIPQLEALLAAVQEEFET
jgi:hypothetical protein